MADRNIAATASLLAADLARRSGLSGFGAWWSGELAAVAPLRLRGVFARRKLRPVLAIDGDQVVFYRPTLDGTAYRMQQMATVAAGGDASAHAAEGRAALAAIIAPGALAGVTVTLPPRAVLRRTLTLPAAVADDLRATVGYDLDRLTPFKPEDVYFDASVVARDAVRGTIAVDVVAARRRTVDQAVALARSFGADVLAVVPATPDQAALVRLDLLPGDDHGEGRAWTRWQLLLPLALLLALALAAVLVPIWQKRADTIALMRATDAESVRAQESDRLRSQLEHVTREYNFPLERKLAHPSAGQVLEEITRLLPEDTWLTQLELKTQTRGTVQQRDVFIRGESANAGRLVSLLEDAKYVGQATPRSPTTKLQPGPGESFDLGIKVKALALPAMVALADSAAPPPVAPRVRASEAPAVAPADATRGTAAPPAAGIAARGPGATALPADGMVPRASRNEDTTEAGAESDEESASAPSPTPAARPRRADVPGALRETVPGVPREAMPPAARPKGFNGFGVPKPKRTP